MSINGKVSQLPTWYKQTRYRHFDIPIIDPESVRPKVESGGYVSAHGFLPFLHFESSTRKFKLSVDGVGRFERTIRPISYAAHLDSCIFRYYANALATIYEQGITAAGLQDSVIAYRTFRPSRSNIHFAHEVFNQVCTLESCTVLAFDVRNFFEGLDHGILKKAWKDLLGADQLPCDHYKVFRAVTKYAYVDRTEVLKKLNITKKRLKNLRGPLCSPEVFRSQIRGGGLIQVRAESCGIPQGSSMSGLLSNVYMFELDVAMKTICEDAGEFYRRYSDDILLVLRKPEDAQIAQSNLERLLTERRLKLHDGPGKSSKSECAALPTGKMWCSKPIHYLGFSFNGTETFIRHHTISQFLRRMRRAVYYERCRAIQIAARSGNRPVFRKQQLYAAFSTLGRRNFIKYAERALRISGSAAIKRQLLKCSRRLRAELESQSI